MIELGKRLKIDTRVRGNFSVHELHDIYKNEIDEYWCIYKNHYKTVNRYMKTGIRQFGVGLWSLDFKDFHIKGEDIENIIKYILKL